MDDEARMKRLEEIRKRNAERALQREVENQRLQEVLY